MNFFFLYEQQTELFMWGYNAIVISNLSFPTSALSGDN